MDQKLMRDVAHFVEENKENVLRDIGRLVAIDSVMGEEKPGMPFGEGPAQALKLGLEIAGELGLEAHNCEDRMGYAQVGQGTDYLATITHLDVVPSVGWAEDPFTLRRREGYIIGRGVMDDKGPSVLCLYALKYLKDSGMPLRYPVRALLGINEENHMADLDYYLANYKAPLFCFSPDADFPLCNGEKGIFHGKVVSWLPMKRVKEIRGGVAANVIPDLAEAWVEAEKLSSTERVTAQREGDCWHLTAKGIGGHASAPEGTVNAIGVLVDYILEQGILSGAEEDFFYGLQRLHSDPYGVNLGLDTEDMIFTPLTIVGGVIGMEEGHVFQTVDCRYPTTSSGQDIVAQLTGNWGELAQVHVLSDDKPFYMALDNPAVQVCVDTYNAVTGEQAQPYTIGGGTYARHFPNAVSFGPEHPERPAPDFAGPIHGVDEAANIDWLMEALQIYILALIELEKLDY
ncbi:MAG: Sapep family Mn(2+)-dependent dipeptidase [bacterium]|nr:Sapep family Mn(2+)-dependent dipeptidase [bacterium]